MRKYIKPFIIVIILVGVTFILSGCAWYSNTIDFEFDGGYMADKYVDLLIEIDKTEEFYTDYNCNIEGDTIISENSEIVKYDKDGLCSMLMHMKNAKLSILICDSEDYPDYHEDYSGIPSKISQHIFLPNERLFDYSEHSDPYGEIDFCNFCKKYKKCHVAIFDQNGNILKVSRKIPLVSMGNFYLQNISYDVENNRINPDYTESPEVLILFLVILLFQYICMTGCIITLIVSKVNKNKSVGYVIASALFNIPTAVMIIYFIYFSIGKSITFLTFITTFLYVSQKHSLSEEVL